MSSLRTNNNLLAYKAIGQGDSIVILHGLFGAGDNWQTIGRELAKTHQVILVDLINHGLSPRRDLMTYDNMAQDILDLINHLNLKTITLVGHSMGGKVAMQLTAKIPHQIKTLIVADIAPKAYPPHHQDVLAGLQHVDLTALTSRQDADTQLAIYIKTPALRQFLLKSLRRTETGFDWLLNIPAIKANYPNIMLPPDLPKNIPTPTKFLKGQTSDYILDTDLPLIHDHFPNATLTTISNAGHWLHAENPEQVLKEIQNTLRLCQETKKA